MKRNLLISGIAVLLAAAAAVALPQQSIGAQVVREDGVSSFVGILTSEDTSDEYSFKVKSGDIIHADVDADVYELIGSPGGHHELAAMAPDEGHDDGCGGPGGLVLEILDDDGNVVCWADRPTRPGWQRDAAVHCPFADGGTYWLRIGLSEHDPHEHAAALTPSEPLGEGSVLPYLVNVSLRSEAPEGLLTRAIAISNNTLP
jgi:hypothetical protein